MKGTTMLKRICLLALLVIPAKLFCAQVPDIFYQTSGTFAQIGVIRNFDDTQVKVLHDNARSIILPAAVHPGNGRYAFWTDGSAFENFEFGEPGRRLVFGSIAKGSTGWTLPETNFSAKDYKYYIESRPRFSLDGNKVFSTATFRYNAVISAYDLQTGASERIFYNRWPRTFSKGLPFAALSRDEKTIVFSAVRYRYVELYTYPLAPAPNELPAFVLRSYELPFDLYKGKDFIVYKTFREMRYRKRKTILHLYDFRIVEHYGLLEYPDTLSGSPEPASQDFVVDERNRLLYTAVHSPEKNALYRVNLRTLKVDTLLRNVIRVFDVTRDGRYLLYTKYRDEAELVSRNAAWSDNPVIAVYDLQTREVKEMSPEGSKGFESLSFVYRD
jgi:hypothetical protein